MHAGARRAWSFALRAFLSPSPAGGSTRERSWKLFLLLPRLLFTRGVAANGKAALLQRLEDFLPRGAMVRAV